MFPHEIKNAGPDTNGRILRYFRGEPEGFVQVGDQKWIFPAEYAKHASGYYQFSPKPDDVWIMTYPRSGTTLSQELIWLLKNSLDFQKSTEIGAFAKSFFFEFNILFGPKYIQDTINLNSHDPAVIEMTKVWTTPGYEACKNLPSPRIIKTHLPFCLLPPSLLTIPKVVYVARNPKDVFISYYHHNKLIGLDHHEYRGDMKTYWQFFKEDLVCFSPYWEHVKQAWDQRNQPNILFIFYENLAKDLFSETKKIARFLNVNYSDEQFQQLVDHLEINNFRRKVPLEPSESAEVKGLFTDHPEGFIRKGKVGGGDPELTPELSREIDEWVAANLKNTDLRFPDKTS